MLPNFLCIGGQKCGTTWLHYMLAQHPQICMPRKKELFFFDIEENFEGLGREGYEDFFSHHDGEPVVGEITPAYLWTEQCRPDYEFVSYRRHTPDRVKALLGDDVKIIVLIRNPARRALSAFVHHMHRGRIAPGQTMMDAGRRYGILGMGFYRQNLAAWYEQFDPERFLIRSYDDVRNDKQAVLRDVYRFLGVDESFAPQEQQKHYQKTLDYLVEDRGVFLPRRFGWNRKILGGGDIAALNDLYADEIRGIEEEHGLSLAG